MVDLAEGTNNALILKWTERLTIDAQKKVVTKSSKDRIIAIDWWKGFAIIWITAYHLGVEWVLPQDMWIVRFVIVMGLWFVGPPTFLFFAGVNITLSYRLGLERKLSYDQLYYETFRRMMGLYLVSLVWNLITDISPAVPYTGISIIFRWEILQCIVFSTLLTFPLLKHSIHTRLIIAVIILAISYPFYSLLVINQSQSPLARGLILALFFPYLTSPLFPTIAYTIMGSVVIDLLFPIIKKIRQPRTGGENLKGNVVTRTFKILLILSVGTILLCILLGSGPNADPLFQAEASTGIIELHANPAFASWSYIPDFLIRGAPITYIYDLGWVTLSFLLCFYYFDMRQRENYVPSKATRLISFFGLYSLSYFTYGFLFSPLGLWANAVTFWFGIAAVLVILTLIFQFLLKKAYGGGLVEWVMVLFAVHWSRMPAIKDIQAVYPEKIKMLQKDNVGASEFT